MLKELVIPFSDLRKVSIECADCHALIVLDLEGQHDVTHCAACNRDFEPGVKSALTRLHGLYLNLKDAKHKIAFRVPVTD